MTLDEIGRFVSETKAHYRDAETAKDGDRTLIRIPEVGFPKGCRPERSAALIVLDPGQPEPQFFVERIPRLPSGAEVSSGPTIVGGQPWFTFSFSLRWDKNKHSAVQFVEGKLRRFARDG